MYKGLNRKTTITARLIVVFSMLTMVVGLLVGCAPEGETGLQGQLLFQDKPLAQAQVEVYLKAEKNRSTQPFAVTTTDVDGRYQVSLPDGDYYVIGKLRDVRESGRARMLMAEAPGNPQVVAGKMLKVPAFSLYEMGQQGELVADAGTGVIGRVTHDREPLERAYVYVYTESTSDLMGPSYGEAVLTDADGRFQIDLPAGLYHFAARKRIGGDRSGELEAGDLNSIYPGNPVEVTKGEVLELDDFSLQEVDAVKKSERLAEGTFSPTKTLLSGQVVDQDDLPVSGIYLFAYLDSRMIGKPGYISAPTDEDGNFQLYLADGGTYYVGARSTFGGPLEPGESVGTYDEDSDHGVTVASGEQRDLGKIIVREVW